MTTSNNQHYHILLCTPCYGSMIFNTYFQSTLKFSQLAMEQNIELTVLSFGNESLVQRARNFGVASFLAEKKFTHLLFIDSDITYDGSKIIEWVKSGRNMVSGIYPKKNLNIDKLIEISKDSSVDSNLYQNLALDYVVNFEEGNVTLEEGRYIKAQYAGTGCLLIKRVVIETMLQRYPETKYRNDIKGYEVGNPEIANCFYALFDCFICPKSNRYLSEDFAFIQRAKDSGFDLDVDITMDLTHTGIHHYQGSFCNKLLYMHYLQTKHTKKTD